jgi:hypothetical protein
MGETRLYKLCNCSFLKNHVALVVVGKLVGEIFDVALTSLLPAVERATDARHVIAELRVERNHGPKAARCRAEPPQPVRGSVVLGVVVQVGQHLRHDGRPAKRP